MKQVTPQQQYWSDVIKLTIDYTNRKHSVWPDLIGSEIHKRKNALLYRWSASWWHVSLAEQVVTSLRVQIRQSEKSENLPILLRRKLDQCSFLFDDTVFNLLSMFDYLAGLIGLVMIGDLHKWQKWNSLVKMLRSNNHGYPKASGLIIAAHQGWVDKLAAYRASVYHEKTDIGSAEYRDDFERGNVQLDFFVPAGAMRAIPVFKAKEKVELVIGLRNIVERSSQIQYDVLEAVLGEDL